MKATYMKRFQKLSHTLKNTDLMEHVRMDEHNTFSRKRKMPLEDILLSCLARKGAYHHFRTPYIFQTKRGFVYANIETRLSAAKETIEP